jgi:hypothetical protein
MTERSWVHTPHYGDHFSGNIHLDQSLEQNLWENSKPGIVVYVVILQKEGWTLRNGWFIKTQLHGTE